MGLRRAAWVRFRQDRASLVAVWALLCIVAVAALGPPLAEYVLHADPASIARDDSGRLAILRPPTPEHLLGTDDLGRDVLTRLVFAGRVSLSIGGGVALVSLVLGAPLGLLAAYHGGWADDLINSLVQSVLAMPRLFALIVMSIFLAPNAWQLTLIFGLFFWPDTARQVRGAALSVRQRDYVQAARVLGASNRRVLLRHVAPNVVSVMLVMAGVDMAAAILAESSLSFLGFGVPVPLSSWGNMVSLSQDVFGSAPWLVYPPGLMIFITVLCVLLVSDGLRDALDPKDRLSLQSPTGDVLDQSVVGQVELDGRDRHVARGNRV